MLLLVLYLYKHCYSNLLLKPPNISVSVRAAELRHKAGAAPPAADSRVAAGAAEAADHGARGKGQLRAAAQAEGGAPAGAGEGGQDNRGVDIYGRHQHR